MRSCAPRRAGLPRVRVYSRAHVQLPVDRIPAARAHLHRERVLRDKTATRLARQRSRRGTTARADRGFAATADTRQRLQAMAAEIEASTGADFMRRRDASATPTASTSPTSSPSSSSSSSSLMGGSRLLELRGGMCGSGTPSSSSPSPFSSPGAMMRQLRTQRLDKLATSFDASRRATRREGLRRRPHRHLVGLGAVLAPKPPS